MTGTAVVTGSTARVDDVAGAIERRGVTALRIDRAGAGAALASLPAGSLEYYIQLPGDVPSPRTTRAGAVSALFGQGLMSRCDEVEALLPKLAPNCAVVLVTGEMVAELSSVEYPHAPTCVLEMLAEAIVTDLAPSPVRATVVSHCHSAEQIADIALASGPQRESLVAGFAARAPEMAFDDWRLACLSTTGPEA